MKKILLILFLALLIGLGTWYFFFHRSNALPGNTTGTGTPFGVIPDGGVNTGGAAVTPTSGSTSTTTPATLPNLFKITSDPVAGMVVFLKNKIEIMRYVDRASGHIYDVNPLTLEKVQIVNTTSPKIYEALWKPDGSAAILRSLNADEDTIKTVSLTLTPPKSASTTEYTVSAVELRGNISELASGKTAITYVQKDSGNVTTSGYAGQGLTTLYTSAFKQWQITPIDTGVVLTTNASATANGYAYTLSTGGTLSKILGPLPALTTLMNPDGSRVLYSYTNGPTKLEALNTKSRAVTNILPATLPEKCAWSTKVKSVVYCGVPSSSIATGEPDNWYQGETHYSDRIWKFDTDSGIVTLLAEPKKLSNADIDVINPTLNPNEDYLLFMNKTDLSLWALKI